MSAESEELEWQEKRARGDLKTKLDVLEECHSLLMVPVRLPLTVSCQNVFRGVLLRSGPHATITLHVKLHRTHFTIQNESVALTQVSFLLRCIRGAILVVTRKQTDAEGILAAVMQAIQVLETGLNAMREPEPQLKFPRRQWMPKGIPRGYCGEVVVESGATLLFSLLAYHDGGIITDTTNSRSPDPNLASCVQKLTHLVDDMKLLERNLVLCLMFGSRCS